MKFRHLTTEDLVALAEALKMPASDLAKILFSVRN